MNKILFGINGCSGSGKSTISNKLRDINNEIIIINQDMFYKDIHDNIDIKNYNFDHPSSFDMNYFIEILKNIKKGDKIIKVPYYDYKIHKRIKYDEINIENKRIFIIDGIYLFNNKKIRDLLDIKIYVDTDLDICLLRRIKRDILERGRDMESILERYEKYVKYSYIKYIKPYKKHANIIFPNSKNNLEYLFKFTNIIKII